MEQPDSQSPSASDTGELETGEPENWWSRPCGVRDVVTLALPLVISTISWTVMNFVDRMFLAWHSLPAMAASMPAGMLFFSLVCFPMGLAGDARD